MGGEKFHGALPDPALGLDLCSFQGPTDGGKSQTMTSVVPAGPDMVLDSSYIEEKQFDMGELQIPLFTGEDTSDACACAALG